ncbi:hypothetical protein C0216_19730 [Streptomyces globosus]|uniref:Uncharacterized protein n=1 Tax=Streptomyces globosus TaxID=68209 RepID=A0A344U3B0_9ACTN|nr:MULTISPECIES: hypothetical protein [Streptomyces]AXE25381.1 hypothetical protein C0216_19730 [Streptomyces globosus]
MTVLRHSVSVLALEPHRLQALTRLVLDFAASTRADGQEVVLADGRPVPDMRLVRGRHLRPGARYELWEAGTADQVTVLVREWRRHSAIALEQRLVSDDVTAWMALRLCTPDRPRLLEAEGRVRGPEGSGALRRGSGKARLDLAAWWAAACLPSGTPPAARAPVTARLKHPLGKAHLSLRPRRADGGRWQVDVTLTVRGRRLLRPVAAIALAVAGRRVQQGFRSAVEQAADSWNRSIGELRALSPDDLRAELARHATERTPEDPRSTPASAPRGS